MAHHTATAAASAPAPASDWIGTKQAGVLLCGQKHRSVRNHFAVGTRTPAGVIRLRFQRLGGRLYTKAAWVAEYLEAINAAFATPVPPPVRTETPTQFQRRAEREYAEAEAVLSGRRRGRKAR